MQLTSTLALSAGLLFLCVCLHMLHSHSLPEPPFCQHFVSHLASRVGAQGGLSALLPIW